MLPAPDVAFFEEHGYWIAPVLFDAADVERFRAALARVEAGEHRRGRAPILDLPIPPDPTVLRKIDNAWWADDDLAALATDARLGEIAARLAGVDSVRLWQDQLLDKPPSGRRETSIGWHQDWDSWHTVSSTDAFVTAWVALDDVDEANAAMQVIPGSHRWGHVVGASDFLGSELDAQLERLSGGRDVTPVHLSMRAGQVSFHHVLAFHGSGPNTSTRRRRSLAVHYVDAAVRSVDQGEGWRHYNLDLLRRRGGAVGDPYALDDLWPVVFPAATS